MNDAWHACRVGITRHACRVEKCFARVLGSDFLPRACGRQVVDAACVRLPSAAAAAAAA